MKSQFATSYGMALNLLFSRTMPQARAFLDRSFSRYLGGAGVVRVLGEADRLERKANEMLEEAGRRAGAAAGAAVPGIFQLEGDDVEADVWSRYQKLVGRSKEEKRGAKVLRAQLAGERGTLAVGLMADIGLPCCVGLDLSGTALDGGSYKLPAIALRALDTGPGSGDLSPRFLCLGSDNMLYAVSAVNVAAVSDAELTPQQQDAVPVAAAYADAAPRLAWQELAGGVTCIEGSALTAAAAASLPLAAALSSIVPSEPGMAALREQKGRLAALKVEMAGIKGDRRFARASKRYSQIAAKAGVLLDRAAALREEVRERADGGWIAFEAVVRVLEHAGAFEPGADQDSPL